MGREGRGAGMYGVKRVVPRYDSPAKRWRKVLFDNCMDRLQDRRAEMFAQRRTQQTIVETICEEADILKDFAEPCTAPEEALPAGLTKEDLLDLEHEILVALETQQEEQREMELNYVDRIAEEEAEEIALDMQALALYDLSKVDEYVLCPSCLNKSLSQAPDGIRCSCGVHLPSQIHTMSSVRTPPHLPLLNKPNSSTNTDKQNLLTARKIYLSLLHTGQNRTRPDLLRTQLLPLSIETTLPTRRSYTIVPLLCMSFRHPPHLNNKAKIPTFPHPPHENRSTHKNTENRIPKTETGSRHFSQQQNRLTFSGRESALWMNLINNYKAVRLSIGVKLRFTINDWREPEQRNSVRPRG